MEKVIKSQVEIGGRVLTLELGRFTTQANASVLAQYGETVVLATVVSSSPREDLDYFPLTVEYRERYYAGGRISTSRFVKRERRPRDDEVLTARLIDRSIRPLFPKDFRNEVQVIVTVLSYDGKSDPGLLGLVATSAALAISDIPWDGPVGGVRVGDDPSSLDLIINPAVEETENGNFSLVVVTTKERVVMMEAFAAEVTEEKVMEAINLASKESRKIVDLISGLATTVGRKKQEFESGQPAKELIIKVEKFAQDNLNELLASSTSLRGDEEGLASVRQEMLEKFGGDYSKKEVETVFNGFLKRSVREGILSGKRPDGRKWDQIRKLDMNVGVLPRTHGSAVFERGETQVLSVVTLGTPSLEQWIESMEGEARKGYIHHYNMPPYSVGETGRLGWPSRREVGHGALAERALQRVVPDKEKFPYMIRVVSEVMSSNGSTSMASVCGSSLALMDAGVPIKSPVAGIAMGLVTQGKKQIILTDITGLEDGFGDMDFKIAGTKKGITALQMDVKISGLSVNLVQKIFTQAQLARVQILEAMAKVLPAPRSSISSYAPKIEVLHVEPETIGEIIGPGGRVIREIIAKTQAGIDVEDDGTVTISGETKEIVAKALRWIEGITKVVKVGETYEGEVVRIEPYGAFVQIAPGKEGLVHVSEMAPYFVRSASEVVKLGQKVKIRVAGIDELGRIKLSMLFGQPARSGKPRRSHPFPSAAARGRNKIPRRPRR
jgi:polyribonucleotide nucleotidyltransferase